MGKSAKVARVGKTKSDRDRVKIAKNTNQVTKKEQPKKLKSAIAVISETHKKPTIKPEAVEKKKYVTDGMPDYVTLMKSRTSGDKLKKAIARKHVFMK